MVYEVVLISAGNFQDYMIYNIKNLILFGNNNITEEIYFEQLKDYPVNLINCKELDDLNYNMNSRLDRQFRNGFWHLCSLRLFYLYSYMNKFNKTNIIHLENDVMVYENLDLLNFIKNNVYVTYDAPNRVIPGFIFVPNKEIFKPIIDDYNFNLNDMENLCKHNLEPLPIIISERKCVVRPVSKVSFFCDIRKVHIEESEFLSDTLERSEGVSSNLNKYNQNFGNFNCIFDAAAMGQYLGGVDKRNQDGDTRGFVNETCIVKYNNFEFFWIKKDNLYRPHIYINLKYIPIINLHVHSKELNKFMGNNPLENKLIKFQDQS